VAELASRAAPRPRAGRGQWQRLCVSGGTDGDAQKHGSMAGASRWFRRPAPGGRSAPVPPPVEFRRSHIGASVLLLGNSQQRNLEFCHEFFAQGWGWCSKDPNATQLTSMMHRSCNEFAHPSDAMTDSVPLGGFSMYAGGVFGDRERPVSRAGEGLGWSAAEPVTAVGRHSVKSTVRHSRCGVAARNPKPYTGPHVMHLPLLSAQAPALARALAIRACAN